MKQNDLPAVKNLIDSTGLFPSHLLDDMASDFLNGTNGTDRWKVLTDGEAIGVAYFAPERMAEGTWNLYLIAIHAEKQGAGEGTKLIKHVEEALAEDGQRLLLVETSGDPDFERTRQFYRNQAYTQEARIREFYASGEDKIVFWKKLTQ